MAEIAEEPMPRDAVNTSLWTLYVFKALQGLVFLIPVLVLFLQENGLSMVQVLGLHGIYLGLVAALQIPSRYVSDRMGRKFSFVTAAYLLTIGVTLYSIGHGFTRFLTGHVFWSLGAVLVKESDAAFLRDCLAAIGDTPSFEDRERFMHRLTGVSLVLSAVAGGVLAAAQLRYAVYASALAAAALIPVAFLFREPREKQPVYETGGMRRHVERVKHLFTGEQLRWLTMYEAFMAAVFHAVFWLSQPFFASVGLPLQYIGVLYAVFYLAVFTGEGSTPRLATWIGWDRVMIGVVVGAAAVTGGMAWVVAAASTVFATAQLFGLGVLRQLSARYRETVAGRSHRLDAAADTVTGVLAAVLLPVAGWAADVYTVPVTFAVLGVSTFVVGGTLLFLLCRADVL